MTTTFTTSTPTRPTWRQWVVLLLLGLPMFMMATDFTAIFLAVPAVSADLAPSAPQTLWLVHVGELVAAGTLITMGWLTLRIGPRTLLLIALALYGAASTLAAFSPNAETLIFARVLIGAATAAVGPAGFAMLRSLFTSARHYGIGFAVVMGAFPVGAALGPPLTGALLEHFWWGSVFLINVPVAALALAGGLWLFPGSRERTTDRIDVISVVVSMAAVMLVVFGLQEIADQGFSLTYALSIGAGIVLGAWFTRRQRRITNPLLDLGLFTIRILRLMTIFFILSGPAFMAVDFVLIQYLQIALGVSTGALGLILAVPGIAAILATAMTPALTRRFTPATVMAAALSTGVAGTVVILSALTVFPAIALFAVGMTAVAFGMSPAMVLGAQLMLTSVPKRQTGPAASVQDIGASIGAAIGIMVLGSLALSVFSRLLSTGAPSGVSDAALDAAADSPGAAAVVADGIGGARGEELLGVVQEAWLWGTVSAYSAALGVAVVMMVVIVRGLRGVELPSDEAGDAHTDDADHTDDAEATSHTEGHDAPAAQGTEEA